ncbi:ROK family transcriptional regulator [Tessaracoccus aquimaris]|uniref:ROK family transcriptional regulator n=1 Tax=Tessaracoccus aquimaris TaxID=1332264 RepID=UPI0009893EBC|nr:ROK family transcriptional regulator [Tessaracoccus aquimaris]
MIKTKPGVPSLLRELNDSAVLRHIMEVGAVTRSELAAHTGLSRVTSSQALSRLQALGVVRMHGTRSGARGPAAELYELVPTIGTAVGIAVYADLIRVQLCGLDGVPVASLEAPLGDDVVSSVTEACRVVCEQVGESHGSLLAAALATPGVVDPASGELSFSYDLRDAETLRGTLSDAVGVPFVLGNDVHLAALAEQSEGVAKGEQDFVLLWIGRGLGMASVIGGKVRVGSSGAAGEIGYLPVPGVPLPSKVDNIQQGSFQRLVGMEAVLDLVRAEGTRRCPRGSPRPW